MPICFVPAVINRLFCCAILLVIGSCAGEKKQEAPKKTPITEAPILVARIQSRPGGKDFVLLESYEKWTLEDGVNLFSTGSDGSTAALVTSGEKLGQFVAADLISGHVENRSRQKTKSNPCLLRVNRSSNCRSGRSSREEFCGQAGVGELAGVGMAEPGYAVVGNELIEPIAECFWDQLPD
jgi:hypothetical protein